jgi:hypothetical protein
MDTSTNLARAIAIGNLLGGGIPVLHAMPVTPSRSCSVPVVKHHHRDWFERSSSGSESGGKCLSASRRSPAIVLGHSSGRFLEERAGVAPGPDPECASSSLRGASFWRSGHPVCGPWRSAAGIGGGHVRHAELNKRERLAGPSVPSFATPNSWFDLTPRISQRAERRQRTRRLRHALSSHQARCCPVDRN